jgi:hypothetical protein
MKNNLLLLVLLLAVQQVFSQGCTVSITVPKDTIVCGERVTLSAYGHAGIPVLTESFNSGSLGPGWQATNQAVYNNPCGANTIDGTTYIWMGGASDVPRTLTTKPFNLSSCTNAGVTICFDMKYAVQGANSPCEGPDLPNEGVYLQYSTNGGTTWTTLQYWDPNGGNDPTLTNWNNYCVNVPLAALTANTEFRWNQDAGSGAGYDNWGIDNVAIECNDPSYSIVWPYNNYNGGPTGGANPTPVAPHSTTTYTVTMSNGTYTCADSVKLVVVNPILQLSAGADTSVCAGTCAQLQGVAKVIEHPAKVPTYHNTAPDTASITSFGGVITQGATVGLNVATLNMNTIQSNSILKVCVDQVQMQGFGVGATDLQLVLLCPDSTAVVLVPTGQATGTAGLFNYNTIYSNTCFVPSGAVLTSGTSPYTGSYASSQSFNNMVGCTANGVWTLAVVPQTGLGAGNVIITGWSITFNDPESSYPGTFAWSPTGSITAGVNTLTPTVCPTGNQQLVISMSDTAGCVTTTDTVNVSTHPCCNYTVTPTTVQPACGLNNGSISLAVSPAGNYTFAWGGGSSATTQNITGLAAGSYTVTVTGLGGCTVTTTITLTAVNGLSLTVNTAPATCGNPAGSVQVTANGGTAPYSYTWAGSSATTASITGLSAGTYSVTVADAGQCSASATATVVATAGLGPVTITSDKNDICSGDTAHICAPNGFARYAWNTGAATACVAGIVTDYYNVTVTDNNNCTGSSNTIHVGQYPLPPVSFSANGDTLQAYNAAGYQWYYNGSPIPGATASTYVANQPGEYLVEVTDTNGCKATSAGSVVFTGIAGVSADMQVMIYPNPLAAGEWNIQAGNNWLGAQCTIYDADGRLVYNSTIQNNHSVITADVARGIYTMRLSSGQNTFTIKLIKL